VCIQVSGKQEVALRLSKSFAEMQKSTLGPWTKFGQKTVTLGQRKRSRQQKVTMGLMKRSTEPEFTLFVLFPKIRKVLFVTEYTFI
jgi:hypothetical protein